MSSGIKLASTHIHAHKIDTYFKRTVLQLCISCIGILDSSFTYLCDIKQVTNSLATQNIWGFLPQKLYYGDNDNICLISLLELSKFNKLGVTI